MLQFLIEEALLQRIELEAALEQARQAEQQRTDDAVDASLRRREQAQLALQHQAAS